MNTRYTKGYAGHREVLAALTDPSIHAHPSRENVAFLIQSLNGKQMDPVEAGLLAKGLRDWQIKDQTRHAKRLADGIAKGEIDVGFAKAIDYDNIGTQLQGQAFTSQSPNAGSVFAPFVPQSITQQALDVTVKPSVAWLLNYLPKRKVDGLVHETALLLGTTNRPAQRSFLAESGTGSASSLSAARTAVTIRCEYIQNNVSLAGQYAGMLTPSGYVPRAGMEVAQSAAMRALLQKRAQNVWWANPNADPLSYSGFVDATAGLTYSAGRVTFGNGSRYVTNLDGARIDFDTLLNITNEKNAAVQGQLGTIGHIALHPSAMAYLQKQYQTMARNNGNVEGVKFFGGKLSIMPANGREVEIVGDPSISLWQRNDNTAVQGTVLGTAADPTPVAAPSAYSKFTSAQAGAYIYRLFGIAGSGETAQIVSTAVDVVAGDSVTITLSDSSYQGSSDAAIVYYWVERSAVDGAVGTTKLIGYWPSKYTETGSAANTVIIDDNLLQPDTSPVGFFTDNDPQINEWCDFVDPFMFPLGATGASNPMMVVSFGSPNWILPEFNHVAMNARYS